MDNKLDFSLQNLNNILTQGNEQLINYKNKIYTLRNIKPKQFNKVNIDINGDLYIEKQDGSKEYIKPRQQYGLMPTFCPVCGRIMGKKQFDRFYWGIYKRCSDCSIKYQEQMKDNGTFNLFAINYMKNKLVYTCNRAIQYYKQIKKQSKKQMVLNSIGDIEQWSVQDQQYFEKKTQEIIKQIEQYRDNAIQYFDSLYYKEELKNNE